ncbi:hypothetical protein ABMA09_08210 [Erwinia rhapontici]
MTDFTGGKLVFILPLPDKPVRIQIATSSRVFCGNVPQRQRRPSTGGNGSVQLADY